MKKTLTLLFLALFCVTMILVPFVSLTVGLVMLITAQKGIQILIACGFTLFGLVYSSKVVYKIATK